MRVCQKGRALSMQLYLGDEMKRLWQGMDAFMNQGVRNQGVRVVGILSGMFRALYKEK